MEYINWFQAERGYSPGQNEIVKRFGITAPRAYRFVHALAGRGMIELSDDDNTIMMPEHLLRYPKRHAPIMGTVRCGTPTTAIEDYEGVMELPEEFTGDGKCFILRAKGDSMIDAGIEEGDYLVIREQNYADSGDIVVAIHSEFSDEADATLKKFIRFSDESCVLRAANDKYDDIDFDGFRIVGKLVSFIRKVEEGGDK
jgi:repressor LexA